MRIAPWIALALSLVAVADAQAVPFTADDLVKLESFGQTIVDPTGRWLVFEQRDPAETASRFDLDAWGRWAVTRLKIVDLKAPGPGRDLLADPLPGYVAGPFSPDGRTLVVGRIRDGVWSAGLVDVPTGRYTALPAAPEVSRQGQTMVWRSDHELLMIAMAPGQTPVDLWRDRAASERQIALWARKAAGVQSSAVALGSGRYLASTARPPANRLVSLDTRTGAVRTCAEGEFVDLALAPGGRTLALVARGEPLQPAAGSPVAVFDAPYRRRLRFLDLETGVQTQPCPACDLATTALNWSPDGQNLVVLARTSSLNWSDGRLLIVHPDGTQRPAARGVALPLGGGPNAPPGVQLAWLGDSLMLRGHKPDAGAATDTWWRVEPDGVASPLVPAPANLLRVTSSAAWLLSGDQIWRIGVDGRRRNTGTVGAGAGRFAPDPWSFAYNGGAPPRSRELGQSAPFLRAQGQDIGFAGEPEHHITLPAGGWRPVAWSEPANSLVVLSKDDHGVQTLALAARGRLTPLASVNQRLATRDPLRAVGIDHTGPDGQPLKSWLYLPAGWAPGQKPPLVVIPYPGAVFDKPSLEAGGPEVWPNAQILIGAGYAVLTPSLPQRGDHEPAKGLAAQIIAIVDEAVAQGYVNSDHVALWGQSYGGWAGLITATQTDRFKAIIVSAAASNLVVSHGAFPGKVRSAPELGFGFNGPLGWVESGQGDMAAPPWLEPQRYIRNSAIFRAGEIRTPLLILQNDQDFVSIVQGEQIFSALYRQGKDAQFVTYFGEEHGLVSPANIRDCYARIFAFLDEQLGRSASQESQAKVSGLGREAEAAN